MSETAFLAVYPRGSVSVCQAGYSFYDATSPPWFHVEAKRFNDTARRAALVPRPPSEELPKRRSYGLAEREAALIPLTYVVDLLRGLWVGHPWGDHLLQVGVLAGLLIVGTVVSVKTFRWE